MDAYPCVPRRRPCAALADYALASDEYIEVAAAATAATADTIDAYLHTERAGTGFVERSRIFDLAAAVVAVGDATLHRIRPTPPHIRPAACSKFLRGSRTRIAGRSRVPHTSAGALHLDCNHVDPAVFAVAH